MPQNVKINLIIYSKKEIKLEKKLNRKKKEMKG